MARDHDKEYQLPEEEGKTQTYDVSNEGSPSTNFAKTPQGRRLIALFIIIVSTLILLNAINKKRAAKKVEQPAVQSKVVELKQAEQQPASAEAASDTATDDPASLAQARLDELHNKLAKDDSYMHQLQVGLEHAEASLGEMHDALAAMRVQLETVTKKVAMLEKAKPKPVKKKSKQQVKPKLTYALKAVVRGRAWLVDSKGRSITVKHHDALQGAYGKVKHIDAIRGEVITTSGKIIGYGADDS